MSLVIYLNQQEGCKLQVWEKATSPAYATLLKQAICIETIANETIQLMIQTVSISPH